MCGLVQELKIGWGLDGIVGEKRELASQVRWGVRSGAVKNIRDVLSGFITLKNDDVRQNIYYQAGN